ncbi:lipoyl(octanoyl) transferase LipB [Chloroflexota bacterium]
MSAEKLYIICHGVNSVPVVSRVLNVYHLGEVEYSESYQLQQRLLDSRLDGKIQDTLLLLQHPPVVTIGKSGKLENIIVSPAELVKQGISLIFTDRGGDVTYHGPGQLVVYPIIDLRERGKDIHRYINDLEEVIIRTVSDFSIDAGRDDDHAGVWVNNEELASIGIRIRKWITMHGLALNIKPRLEHFSLINPCGFRDRTATSVSKLLSKDIPTEAIVQRLITHFSEVFGAHIEQGSDLLHRSTI